MSHVPPAVTAGHRRRRPRSQHLSVTRPCATGHGIARPLPDEGSSSLPLTASAAAAGHGGDILCPAPRSAGDAPGVRSAGDGTVPSRTSCGGAVAACMMQTRRGGPLRHPQARTREGVPACALRAALHPSPGVRARAWSRMRSGAGPGRTGTIGGSMHCRGAAAGPRKRMGRRGWRPVAWPASPSALATGKGQGGWRTCGGGRAPLAHRCRPALT